ncbi:protein disulfide isomerase CRELD2 isoform X2 [Nycticebus coucang]|uniref:protein disulfide isomerase CRELD2 isoform X2 n=1 Tax=Nycticebus coucang TaxID=9470 RepID=UPI00234CE652|nr:protein disulfide isomerase CRELD2 isoform X2 [Nycticebus coucang]
MRPPPQAALGLLLLLFLPHMPQATKNPTLCQRCRGLVDKFNQGMVNTAKKNFGGGNTAWEEKTLSKYEFSEIRFLEIVESLCASSDFECNQMLEEQEEHLEAWWLQLKNEYPDLFEWFCVKTLKVCCSPGTYGPDCRGHSVCLSTCYHQMFSETGLCSPKRARAGPRGPAAEMATVAETAADRGTGPASATWATGVHSAPTAWTATSAHSGTRPTVSAQPVTSPVRRAPARPAGTAANAKWAGCWSRTPAWMWTSVRQRPLPATPPSIVRTSTAHTCAKIVIPLVWDAQEKDQESAKSVSLATRRRVGSVQI